MLLKIGEPGQFDAFYALISNGQGKTGLTVTVDIRNPAGTLIVAGGSATELGGGWYTYQLSGASVTTAGNYRATFKTTDSTVMQHLPSLWIAGRAGVDNLDATVSGRASAADYTTARAAKLDFLDVLISSRLAAASYSAAPDAATIAATVWLELLASYVSEAGSAGKLVYDTRNLVSSAQTIADAVWDEQLADHQDAGSTGEALDTAADAGSSALTAAQVWSYATRTLTQPVSSDGSGDDNDAGIYTRPRGDTWSIPMTGLRPLSDYDKLWWTVRREANQPDSMSLIQIILTNPADAADGLAYINKSVAATPDNGAIAVDSDTAITMTLAAVEAAKLAGGAYLGDIQKKVGDEVTTVGRFTLVVQDDITRATS
jgi:hypothetical protein